MEGLFLEKKLRRPLGLAAEVAEPDIELECEGCRIIMDDGHLKIQCLGVSESGDECDKEASALWRRRVDLCKFTGKRY
jgi:hypothetical protein